jgi:hypothetical protein
MEKEEEGEERERKLEGVREGEGKSEGRARVLCTVRTNGVITAEPGILTLSYLVA